MTALQRRQQRTPRRLGAERVSYLAVQAVLGSALGWSHAVLDRCCSTAQLRSRGLHLQYARQMAIPVRGILPPPDHRKTDFLPRLWGMDALHCSSSPRASYALAKS